MLEIGKAERKKFAVDYVQVTEDNLEAVAEWCNGDVRTDEDGAKYVHVRVHRPLNERQTKAYVTDRVLYAGTGYKVYTNKAFLGSFDLITEPETQNVFENNPTVADVPEPEAEAS